MSMQKCVLLLGLVVYLSTQVSARKCYECGAWDKKDECFTNPKQLKFEKTCIPFKKIKSILASERNPELILNQIMASSNRTTDGEDDSEFDCGTIQFYDGSAELKIITRTCIPSNMTCKSIKEEFAEHGYVLDLCSRCYNDLCNAEKLF